MRVAGVRANVISGNPAPKGSAMARLLALRPSGERWVVLDNDATRGAWSLTPEDGLRIAVLPAGCVCCAGQVELRVVLTRLLREFQPQRLLLLPSPQADLTQLKRLLSDRWFAPVLSMRASVWAADCNDFRKAAQSSAGSMPASLAAADVLLMGDDCDFPGPAQLARLGAKAVKVVKLADLSLGLLDEGTPVARPLFASD
jgi:G3E family GTPase